MARRKPENEVEEVSWMGNATRGQSEAPFSRWAWTLLGRECYAAACTSFHSRSNCLELGASCTWANVAGVALDARQPLRGFVWRVGHALSLRV